MEQAVRVGLEVNCSARYAAEPGVFDTWREMVVDHPVSLPMLMAQLQAIRGHDALDRLAELDIPTLILHGTDDRVLPFGNSQLLLDAISGARLEVFEGAGHLLFLEEPERGRPAGGGVPEA